MSTPSTPSVPQPQPPHAAPATAPAPPQQAQHSGQPQAPQQPPAGQPHPGQPQAAQPPHPGQQPHPQAAAPPQEHTAMLRTVPAPQEQQQQQWPQQGAPGAAYVSPIPITRTHLGHALASEWTKIRSVRSTIWTLGVMLILVIGIGTLLAVAFAATDSSLGGESVLGLGFFGVLLGTLCVITLGVLTIASEYGTGMIRTTTTACPSRGRILAAKAIVFFLLVFVITTLSTALVGALQTGIIGAETPGGSDWFRATVGVGLYVATIGLLSLAVGALVRHSAGAITIMIGVVLLPLVLAMFMFAGSMADVRQFLFEYSIPNQLGALYSNTVAASGPQGWEPLWIMLGITVVTFAGAFFATEARDV